MYGAVDIGGTKTLVAIFDDKGDIAEQKKFPTPKNYAEFVNELADIVVGLATNDFKYTIVAAPGLIDRTRGYGLVFGNLPWKNVPLEEDVENIFKCPVRVENDAKLAALSEAVHLKGGFKKVLYITVSTGIGGGLIIDNKIDPNFQDIEVGQILMEHDGQFMRWEDFASGSAIYKKYGQKAYEISDSHVWHEITRNLALGINTLIATLDPDVIVMGGGVGAHFDKFKDKLMKELKIYENPLTPIPPIKGAVRAEEAVIYGCYELARQHGKNT